MPTFDDICQVVEIPSTLDKDREFWSKQQPRVGPKGQLLGGGMFAHQKEWWELKNFIKLLVGGFGSGKTFIGSKRIIALALQNAPCPVAAVSPTFQQARQTIVLTITALLNGKQSIYGRKGFWWRYNKTTHEFTIRFHGREAHITVYSADDPNSLRGPNIAAAWMDEPFLMEEEVFKQMIARVRHPDATLREIIMTGTPEQLNWGYDIAIGEQKDRYDLGMVCASTRQNIALDGDYVHRLEGAYTDKAAEAYIDGRFVNLAKGIVYYGFDPHTHVVDLPIPESAELVVGMDFNVNPMACVVFWRAGSHLHAIKEYQFPNADTEFVCSVLRDEWVDHRPPNCQPLENIYPDATGNARKTSSPSGRSDFWYIRQAGFNVCARSTNPNRRDRYNAVNSKFKPRTSQPTLTIGKKCKNLIKFLSLYSHDKMNKQQEMSHLLDALGYPISYLFPVDKETFGVHRITGV